MGFEPSVYLPPSLPRRLMSVLPTREGSRT